MRDNQLRILLVSFIGDNRWSGAGKWSYKIAEGLERLGHRSELWFADHFPVVRRTRRFGRLLFPWVLAGRLLAHRKRFDVAVVHEPSGSVYGLLRLARPDLPPMVLMCHNVESHVFRTMSMAARSGLASVTLKNRVMFHCVHRFLSDGAIRLADQVVCLSATDWEYLATRLRRWPADLIRKVNGVDASYFVRDRAYGRPPRVLFVGGWLDVKGRRVLPPIWSRVAERFPDATLSIVGTGCSPDIVLNDFPPAARPNVRAVTRVETEQGMAEVYRTHDIFLMPSLTEGSPLSLMEAMAAGLAVVAADVGGIPDIVTPGVDGLLFPRGSAAAAAAALEDLLTDPGRVAEFGAAGRRRADELTWDASAAAIEAAALAALRRGTSTEFAGRPGRWPPIAGMRSPTRSD